MLFGQFFANNLKEFFKVADVSLTVLWGCKMMSDISGRDIVNRFPIVTVYWDLE